MNIIVDEFEGAEDFTLDTKGRFSIPARHRELLLKNNPTNMVSMTVHPTRCIWMMTPTRWKEIKDQLNNAPMGDDSAIKFKKIMIGNAVTTEMDAAGRVLLTPGLRRHIPIDITEKQTLWLVGATDHLEIWTDEGWSEQNESAFEIRQSGKIPEGMAGLW